METLNQHHEIAATFLARVFLGCLFFFQGYDAVFKVKIKNVVRAYNNNFTNNNIPRFITIFAAWFTSCTAFIGGCFLITGIFEYATLYVLGLNLILTSIGFGINTPMWDTRFVLPRLILIIFLLIVPGEWNQWSLDCFFFPDSICKPGQ